MKIDELFPSQYLRAADIKDAAPLTVTIRGLALEDVGDGETKPIVYFERAKKGLVLNRTNGEMLAHICGSDESDHWIGHQVQLCVEPVAFRGKIVDGLRLRPCPPAPAPAAPVQPAASRPDVDAFDDEPAF
jgi:hypothetical protein